MLGLDYRNDNHDEQYDRMPTSITFKKFLSTILVRPAVLVAMGTTLKASTASSIGSEKLAPKALAATAPKAKSSAERLFFGSLVLSISSAALLLSACSSVPLAESDGQPRYESPQPKHVEEWQQWERQQQQQQLEKQWKNSHLPASQ
ncbi:hypothetical protein [Acinetobacter larvae]|uniref:hypothetical protein n=1 Tax=Acinetobacter larvae TaxID=1789224 RepID=UPI0012FE6694|nr:hypothetical protein [Acinetobacter larvae]